MGVMIIGAFILILFSSGAVYALMNKSVENNDDDNKIGTKRTRRGNSGTKEYDFSFDDSSEDNTKPPVPIKKNNKFSFFEQILNEKLNQYMMLVRKVWTVFVLDF